MRTVPVLVGLAAVGLVALTACSTAASPTAAPAAGADRSPQATASVTAAAPATATATPTTSSAATTPPATTPTTTRPVLTRPAGGAGSAPPTRRVVLAPVTARGTAVAGYRVVRESGSVDCPDSLPSPVSLSRNVHACNPSAASADVCWAPAIAPRHVLCLRDPWARVLTELQTSGPVRPVRATAAPQPMGLQLSDGDRCRIRDGGAWGSPHGHPDYIGFYGCTKNEIVWGTRTGINTRSTAWTVLVGDGTGPLVTRTVVAAYYVSTAG